MSRGTITQERLDAVLFYGVVGLLCWLVFLIFEPLLVPLAWACILVVLFHPLQERFERRMSHNAAAGLNTMLVMFILVVPAVLLLAAFVRQGVSAATGLQNALQKGQFGWVTEGWAWLGRRIPGMGRADLPILIQQQGEKIAGFLAADLGAIVKNVLHFFFDLIVTLLALFYVFRDAKKLTSGLRNVLPFAEPQRERMISEADELIHASVIFTLLAGVVHGIVGGTAFALAGIPEAVFWGVAMAFFSLLPLVGSSLIWIPASIWLFAHGHYGWGIFVLAACAGVAGLLDNVVRPWLISGRAELSGLVVFVSVLGGLKVFGLLGVVLGPIVVATAKSVLDIYVTGSGEAAR